ncbi:3-hydroxyacyl-ACP dehydratase FabZ [Candidatus Omnitrophota bacterium]
MTLDIQQIKKILPHRYPFLLIDKVVDYIDGESLIAIKNVTANEQFFQGHFPDQKVMPGVLIVEAMAQAGAVYFYLDKKLQEKSKVVYYLGTADAKFLKPVVPGDQLKIVIKPKKLLSKAGFFFAEAFVKDTRVAKSEIGFGVTFE